MNCTAVNCARRILRGELPANRQNGSVGSHQVSYFQPSSIKIYTLWNLFFSDNHNSIVQESTSLHYKFLKAKCREELKSIETMRIFKGMKEEPAKAQKSNKLGVTFLCK
jgi:hypothetical protein